MARRQDVCYLDQRNLKVEGIKPFASGRIRITNRKTGKTFQTAKPKKAFIDSGASGSIISKATLRKLYSKIGPFQTKPGKVVTGNGIKKIRLLEDVEICIDHCCYGGEVMVTDETPGSIMLGTDFLTQSRTSIDFGKGTMVCGVRGRGSVALSLEE